MITLANLKAICPETNSNKLNQYVIPINQIGQHLGLFNNIKRISAFIAQVAHESGGFSTTKENLNYSTAGLVKTFRKYFPNTKFASIYAKNPEKIANRVYANRMGNGSEASGDGYAFRGRGLIQLTGRSNYTRFANSMKMPLNNVISFMETPMGAVASAGWFWDQNKLSIYADTNNFTGLTKRINGGTNGISDRIHHYTIAMKVIQL